MTNDIDTWIEVASASLLEHWRADASGADELLARETARWETLRPLRGLSDAELELHVLPLSDDPRIERRALVPEVLRSVRAHEPDWARRSSDYATRVLVLAARETDAVVLAAHIGAFVDLADPRVTQLATALVDHHDAELRVTIASVLGQYATRSPVLDVLTTLSRDADDDVRNWATFSLAQARLTWLHPRHAAVVDALFARIEDVHEECRGEAWVGLAIARDPRVIPLIHDALAGRRECWLALEAIEEWPRREYSYALAGSHPRWSELALSEARAACERAIE